MGTSEFVAGVLLTQALEYLVGGGSMEALEEVDGYSLAPLLVSDLFLAATNAIAETVLERSIEDACAAAITMCQQRCFRCSCCNGNIEGRVKAARQRRRDKNGFTIRRSQCK